MQPKTSQGTELPDPAIVRKNHEAGFVKISQAMRWLEQIKAEQGDIELLLPDGSPWKKIELVGCPPNSKTTTDSDRNLT